MNIPDELLAAYVDGQLKGAERARVEQAIAQDARLAQRVAQYRASRGRLRGVFDGALHEPMPQRLIQVARTASRPTTAQVIDLARVRAERKRRNEHHRILPPYRIALAACVLGGLLVGAVAERLVNSGGLTEYRDGEGLVASGALADALSNQLADSPTPGSEIHVGLSFKSKDGNYCRTFATGGHGVAGLACHEQEHWRVLTLVSTPSPAVGVGEPAAHRVASSYSPLLMQVVRERIRGEPLDATAEAKARGSDWR